MKTKNGLTLNYQFYSDNYFQINKFRSTLSGKGFLALGKHQQTEETFRIWSLNFYPANSIVICNDVLDVDLWLVDTTKTDAFLQTLSNEDFEEYIDHFSIFSGEKDFKQLDIFNKINIQKNNDSN